MKWIDEFKADAREMRRDMHVGGAVSLMPGPAREPAQAMTCDEFAEYERVARAVGFAPRGLKSDELRRFLSEIGIAIYPLPKVVAYLNTQYGEAKQSATWVWAPLRTADRFTVEIRNQMAGYNSRHSRNGAVARELSPYAKPVPLPVLLTVERILARFPDALFFVNDEYHAPPIVDPFLAVWYGEDSDVVVIERWDEPAFRR